MFKLQAPLENGFGETIFKRDVKNKYPRLYLFPTFFDKNSTDWIQNILIENGLGVELVKRNHSCFSYSIVCYNYMLYFNDNEYKRV